MAAAVDNAVRVVFEAEWSKLQTAVADIKATILGIGSVGGEADEKLTFSKAEKGVKKLESAIGSISKKPNRSAARAKKPELN